MITNKTSGTLKRATVDNWTVVSPSPSGTSYYRGPEQIESRTGVGTTCVDYKLEMHINFHPRNNKTHIVQCVLASMHELSIYTPTSAYWYS